MGTTKQMRVTVNGTTYDVTVELLSESSNGEGSPLPTPHFRAGDEDDRTPSPASTARAAAGPGAIVSPLAGVVASVDVDVNQKVAAGDPLVTLEAMKMKTPVRAPHAGTVAAIHVSASVAIDEGALLVTLR